MWVRDVRQRQARLELEVSSVSRMVVNYELKA